MSGEPHVNWLHVSAQKSALVYPASLCYSSERATLKAKCLLLPQQKLLSLNLSLFHFVICSFWLSFAFLICTVLNSSKPLLLAKLSVTVKRVNYRPPRFRRREDFPGRVYRQEKPLLQVLGTPVPFLQGCPLVLQQDSSTAANEHQTSACSRESLLLPVPLSKISNSLQPTMCK